MGVPEIAQLDSEKVNPPGREGWIEQDEIVPPELEGIIGVPRDSPTVFKYGFPG